MSLTISGSTVGYDTTGLLALINDINLKIIPGATKAIATGASNTRTAIDSVWVGSSAEAFKDKLTYDTEVLCQALTDMGEMIKDDVNNVGSNVEDYDAEIARQLFGASTGGYEAGGYRDVSSIYDRAKEKVDTRHDVVNSIVSIPGKVADVMNRTGATVATATLGLVEGIGEFGEALVDTVAIVGTAVASIGTGIYDGCNAIYCKITGNEYHSATKAMWEGTKGFVAEKWVSGAFDKLYDNTSAGQYLKNNAYGFETTRNVSSGIGYAVGVVALTVATGGIGGAAVGGSAAATSTAVSATSLATTAAVAGFGRGTQNAWADGAGIGEGLLYGGASAVYDGASYYLGGQMAGFNGFQSAGANIATRIAFDTADGAAAGFIDPAMQMIYKDKSYGELFEENGGMKTVMTGAAIGAIASGVGESNNIAKAATGMDLKELGHNLVSTDKVVGGVTISGASLLDTTKGNYVQEAAFMDFLKKSDSPQVQVRAGTVDSDVRFNPRTGAQLSKAETAQLKYINDAVAQNGSAVLAMKRSGDISVNVLDSISNPNAVSVQIQTSFRDINGVYKTKYEAARYIDRMTYTVPEARDITVKLNELCSRVDTSLPIEARAKQVHDIIKTEYSDYMKEGLGGGEAHKVSASLRGLTANNAVGKQGLVCAGYAQTFKEMCDRTGIPCDYVRGTGVTSHGQAGHAWNVVVTESGDQIPVDVCWSATSGKDWFGQSDAFVKGHLADADEAFSSYNPNKANLDRVVQVMDSKYGQGTGMKALQQVAESGNANAITRDSNCREYVSTISQSNLRQYVSERATGVQAMQSNVSVPGSVAQSVPSPSVSVQKLDYIVQAMNERGGDGFGITGLKRYLETGEANSITRNNGARDLIKGLSREEIESYLKSH